MSQFRRQRIISLNKDQSGINVRRKDSQPQSKSMNTKLTLVLKPHTATFDHIWGQTKHHKDLSFSPHTSVEGGTITF